MRSSVPKKAVWVAVLALLLAPWAQLHAAEADAEATESKAEAKAEEKAEAKADDKAEAKAEAKPTGKRKSPGIAGGLAFFPGIAVHGAGHMYAGSWMKGLGLLAIEGAAVGIGYSTVMAAYDDIRKLADGAAGGKIPTNVGSAYQAAGVGLVCTMAFLWTWFDDMAGAPIAANEYNRLAEERESQAQFHFTPMGDGAALALVQKF